MQEDDIAAYLKDHPEFFEANAMLLADIHLPSPHGEGTISLAERQQLAQRDRINALEERFAELVLNAEDNDAIASKIQALNIMLHKTTSFDAIEQLISIHLPEYFNLTDTCLRVWASPIDSSASANLVFSPMPDETKSWMAKQKQPYCGTPPEIVTEDWFIDAAASLVIIPLHGEQPIGFLALASDDKNNFQTGMGTDFVAKVGEIISAALSRYIRTED